MKIQNVNDAAFAAYGRVVTGYDTDELLTLLFTFRPMPIWKQLLQWLTLH